jgi:hypothetical protein
MPRIEAMKRALVVDDLPGVAAGSIARGSRTDPHVAR